MVQTPIWFMSYAKVSDAGCIFGSNVYQDSEHPVAKVKRWNHEYGGKEGWTIVLLSFQRLETMVGEMDIETRYFGG